MNEPIRDAIILIGWLALLSPVRIRGTVKNTNHDTTQKGGLMSQMVESKSAIDMPMYTQANAARLSKISPASVKRWLSGYRYRYQGAMVERPPIIQRGGAAGTNYVSFLDLIDLKYVRGFLDEGVTLQGLRRFLEEARRILGEPHFARERFWTHGKSLFLELEAQGMDIQMLKLGSRGQLAVPPIIREVAKEIEFDAHTKIASRWYPKVGQGRIVLDPAVSFGSPCITGTRITTDNIVRFYKAEAGNSDATAVWFGVHDEDVTHAVAFECWLQERKAA